MGRVGRMGRIGCELSAKQRLGVVKAGARNSGEKRRRSRVECWDGLDIFHSRRFQVCLWNLCHKKA